MFEILATNRCIKDCSYVKLAQNDKNVSTNYNINMSVQSKPQKQSQERFLYSYRDDGGTEWKVYTKVAPNGGKYTIERTKGTNFSAEKVNLENAKGEFVSETYKSYVNGKLRIKSVSVPNKDFPPNSGEHIRTTTDYEMNTVTSEYRDKKGKFHHTVIPLK